jgi:hypothetical protein
MRTLTNLTCAATGIWNENWVSSETTPYGEYSNNRKGVYPNYYYESSSAHGVHQIVFAGSCIEWPRVKKIKMQGTCVFNINNFKDLFRFLITISKDNASMPSGRIIKDTWPTVFSAYIGGSSQVTTNWSVEWEVDGVEPDSLEVGVMLDRETCEIEIYSAVLSYSTYPVRVVYNLAEPTP